MKTISEIRETSDAALLVFRILVRVPHPFARDPRITLNRWRAAKTRQALLTTIANGTCAMSDPRYVNIMVVLTLIVFGVLAFTFLHRAPV
jgi:hypothetical protein